MSYLFALTLDTFAFNLMLLVSITGSIMFLLAMFAMGGPTVAGEKDNSENGMDNRTFTNDDGRLSTLELPRLPARPLNHENSRL